MGGEDFIGIGGPAVVEDVGVLGGEIGEGFEAVLCAGTEVVESVEGGEGDGDGGLEGGYPHAILSIAFCGCVMMCWPLLGGNIG